jgi:hypothetical protein
LSKLTIAITGCKRGLGSIIIAAAADRKRIVTAGRIPTNHSCTDLSCMHLYELYVGCLTLIVSAGVYHLVLILLIF